jgi:hypothetical protein
LHDIFSAVDSSQNGLIPEDDFWEMLEAPLPGKFEYNSILNFAVCVGCFFLSLVYFLLLCNDSAGLDLSEVDSMTMMQLFDRTEV